MQLRPWQREIVHELFDDPRPRHGLVAIPRGNGKSTLAAALALYGLLADGVEGAQVLCVASDQRKDGKHSARRIDLAVCCVMAHLVAATATGLQLYFFDDAA